MNSLLRSIRNLAVVSALALAVLPAISATPASAATVSATNSDLAYWNETLVGGFRLQTFGPTVGPATLARAAAIMHAAIFDTLDAQAPNSQGPPYVNYLYRHSAVDGTNYRLAIGLVGRDLLDFSLPTAQSYFDSRYNQYLTSIGSPTNAAAVTLASSVVTAYKNARTNDGSQVTTAYTADGVPGSWRATGNGSCTSNSAAVTPNFGKVTPFAISSASAYRSALPGGFTSYASLLASSFYTTNFNLVRDIGRDTSTTRTADQTFAARFWANDAAGTYTVVGQLLTTTEQILGSAGKSTLDTSRVYALVSLALADAGISAWDQKYDTQIDLWRPVSAITLADTDGNPNTTAVPAWKPLGNTPCFPSFVSGHAEFGGAWSKVMAFIFTDNTTFTVGTEDPDVPAGSTRTFTSFSSAAVEDASSRLWRGVHWDFDNTSGTASGNQIGTYVAGNILQRSPCVQTCTG
ncbi:MAG: vanadium-dependent haloperoxidase [Actinobacteria bacterium]|nr:vanadium-dependent haloperoxidase [Actinomycetota bacterium]